MGPLGPSGQSVFRPEVEQHHLAPVVAELEPHAVLVLTLDVRRHLADRQVADAEELRQFTRERLAHFKAPHSVTFVTELPKTATGKIQKYVLRGGRAAIAKQ